MQFVFVHGWGFSPKIWHPLQKLLPNDDITNIDLGYFDSPPSSLSNLPENALYIGHSLGVLWILENAFNKMAGLVSISGFDCFFKYIPEEILEQMQSKLIQKPALQLASFQRQCGIKGKIHFSNIQQNNLLEGLQTLMTKNCSASKEKLTIPLLCLAAKDDKIVPQSMTKNIWNKRPIEWSNNGQHILPLERPEWCLKHIHSVQNLIETAQQADPVSI